MNNKIIIAVAVITTAGVVKAWTNNQPITKVVIGGYVLLFVLSLLDIFGGGLSQLAGAIAMVAVVFVILHNIPWPTIIKTVQGK